MLAVHRSERADYLAEALGDLLLDALEDPMVPEVVAVPTRGVERWLTQRLSHRLGALDDDGICANVVFPFPGSLIGSATSLACGFDPETDPWPPDRSVWPLVDLVDEHLADPFLAPLAAHLEAGSPARSDAGPGVRRFATVRHLADLYDRYAVHRPEMVLAWAGGPPGATGNGAGATGGPGDAGWQAELWRRLRARIGVPSPAERLEIAAKELMSEPELLDLPPRLSLFGLTRLPASHLTVLEAIAAHREVHLFLLYPSGELWEQVRVFAEGLARPLRRADDPTVPVAVNPLLRSWGRDAREMQLVLSSRLVEGGEHRPVAVQGSGGARTLLQLLQADVRANRQPACPSSGPQGEGPDPRPLLDPHDNSLQVHSCHGRLRQVEVMRDAILHLLGTDPTLEARDVIVMCPDVESFAPLVHAVFGSRSEQPGPGRQAPGEHGEGGEQESEPGPPQIRVRLADRSIRQTNPILAVAAQLLVLASGRVTASEVLDLAGSEPVRRRFRFDEDDLGQIERWVGETGIRWGLDEEHRVPWKLGHVADNTWKAGLDRLLLGVAMWADDRRLFHDVLPLDDVSSAAVDLAGRLAELVERLAGALDELDGRKTVGEWTEALAGSTERLALAAPAEQWQHDQLHRVLGEVVEAAGTDRPSQSLLDIAEVRSLLEDRLRGRPTRANFRTGDLTICTLVPMRSVPHRVVGLLGLDDGAFPRHLDLDGDDLLLTDPRVGDRDARSEDRQLLLDALLASTEHLVITYEGRDPRTNQQRSPCVPVAELLDAVDRTVRLDDGDPGRRARCRVVVEHPLQSFDQRNFRAGELIPERPWSFDPVDLDGASALAVEPAERRPFLLRPLDRLDVPVVQLDVLGRFLEHPVQTFLRERLGWYGSGEADEVKDALPVELDPLEQWAVGDRLLAARLAGASLDEARAAERGRGLLPPGALGAPPLQVIEAAVEALSKAARDATPNGAAEPESVEINVRLPDGRSLVGTVADVHEAEGESRIVRCLYSQLSAKHRIAAWVRFLALTAARPDRLVSAVTIGRAEGSSQGRQRIGLAELVAFTGTAAERLEAALGHLAVLVDLYDRGMCEPLPIYTKTSEKYAAAVLSEIGVTKECRGAWQSGWFNHGEDQEPEHLLVLGDRVRVEELFAEPAAADESGPGWPRDRSRTGRLARRLWDPVLSHERREYQG